MTEGPWQLWSVLLGFMLTTVRSAVSASVASDNVDHYVDTSGTDASRGQRVVANGEVRQGY